MKLEKNAMEKSLKIMGKKKKNKQRSTKHYTENQ